MKNIEDQERFKKNLEKFQALEKTETDESELEIIRYQIGFLLRRLEEIDNPE